MVIITVRCYLPLSLWTFAWIPDTVAIGDVVLLVSLSLLCFNWYSQDQDECIDKRCDRDTKSSSFQPMEW